jgi:hypothetical protein
LGIKDLVVVVCFVQFVVLLLIKLYNLYMKNQ